MCRNHVGVVGRLPCCLSSAPPPPAWWGAVLLLRRAGSHHSGARGSWPGCGPAVRVCWAGGASCVAGPVGLGLPSPCMVGCCCVVGWASVLVRRWAGFQCCWSGGRVGPCCCCGITPSEGVVAGQAPARLLPQAAVSAPSSPGRAAGVSVSLPLVGGHGLLSSASPACCLAAVCAGSWCSALSLPLLCRWWPPCMVLGLTVAVRTCQFTVAQQVCLSTGRKAGGSWSRATSGCCKRHLADWCVHAKAGSTLTILSTCLYHSHCAASPACCCEVRNQVFQTALLACAPRYVELL